jgi:hypothetical protein
LTTDDTRAHTHDPYTLAPADVYSHARDFPRGPLGHIESAPTAIGFCRLCGANARRTTAVRGVFNCPDCFWQWVDSRVGEQPRQFEDYFTET